jgi:tetratricopeptide (TPR) repeat protein
LGAIQAELGKRHEALASYRAGMSVLEEVKRRFPNDTYVLHEVMLAYAHVGDTLGNPVYDNFGDAAGALIEYRKMAALAQTLHEADRSDVRALGDYGIALLRLGIVSPPHQRRATLEQSHQFLEKSMAQSPQDRPNAIHKAWCEVELGNASQAAGERKAALRYYGMAIETAGSLLAHHPEETSLYRWFVIAAQKVAEDQVLAGNRRGAVSTLDNMVELGRRVEAKAASTVSARAVVARAWHGVGAVNAALAEGEQGAERVMDREMARGWYVRSLVEWRRIEPLEGFTAQRNQEMQATVASLAVLDTPFGRAR